MNKKSLLISRQGVNAILTYEITHEDLMLGIISFCGYKIIGSAKKCKSEYPKGKI